MSDESDISFVSVAVRAALNGHLAEGLYEMLTRGLSEAQRVRVMEAAIQDVRCGGVYGKPPAITFTGFLIAIVNGERAGALCPYGDRETPEAFEILFDRIIHQIGVEGGSDRQREAKELLECLESGWLLLKEEPTFHLEMIYIAPAHRGTGVLSVLVGCGQGVGRQRRYPTAHISSLTENRRAIRAYEKCGFHVFFRFSTPKMMRLGTDGFTLLQAPLWHTHTHTLSVFLSLS
jgi:GNAT superfamily N-acetyltransferase